jgi:hypothetical protein
MVHKFKRESRTESKKWVTWQYINGTQVENSQKKSKQNWWQLGPIFEYASHQDNLFTPPAIHIEHLAFGQIKCYTRFTLTILTTTTQTNLTRVRIDKKKRWCSKPVYVFHTSSSIPSFLWSIWIWGRCYNTAMKDCEQMHQKQDVTTAQEGRITYDCIQKIEISANRS